MGENTCGSENTWVIAEQALAQLKSKSGRHASDFHV